MVNLRIPKESHPLAGDSTLWLFNITMEHGPFLDDFPIKTAIYKGFYMAMLNNQMVHFTIAKHDWLVVQ